MIPIARPALGDDEVEAVREVLLSGQLTQGPKVGEFEERFAREVNRRHAVAVSSGTAALYIALSACEVSAGDEVILPPVTFFASASMPVACGAEPRFADVELGTYTLDPEEVRRSVGDRTKVVMPVDIYGQVATMAPLLELAEEHGVRVIEDACQAHGATYRGRPAGSFGDASCFSFYATKNMTTGEGGMVVTDDEEIAEVCRVLRDQGQSGKYEHVRIGYNFRMTEMAAAIGLVQLRKLNGFVSRRRRNALTLIQRLSDLSELILPIEEGERRHSYYQFIVRLGDALAMNRQEFLTRLNGLGIEARASYPKPLYEQQPLRPFAANGCRVAERILPRLFELPVHPSVTEEDIEKVAAAVRQSYEKG